METLTNCDKSEIASRLDNLFGNTVSDIWLILQCVPKKRTTYFQTAVTPLRIVEIKKVGRDSERARADLSKTYNFFSVTQLGAKIFEFKDDPVPNILCKKY